MKKNLYLILPILIIICFLSFAAVCNLGQTLNEEENTDQLSKEEELQKEIDAFKKENEQNSKENENADDSKKEDTKKDDSKDSDGDKKDEPKSEDKKSDDNKPPVISGIFLDGLDPVDYFFFTNDTYTVRAEATDPEGNNLTFKWSGDGTIASADLNPMTWTAPDTEGVYKITVEATDEKGSTASLTADIYVDFNAAVGEPPKGAVILNIEIVGSDSGKYYKNKYYNIEATLDDPLNEIIKYTYTINNVLISTGPVPHLQFKVPDVAGNIDIVVGIEDKDDNIIDEMIKTIYIEP